MDNVPSACLFCSYGKVVPPIDGALSAAHLTPSAVGQHLDLLLPDFRSARRSTLLPARQAHDHPLPIIQHARSQPSISRSRPIAWTPVIHARSLHDVLTAFAEHVILPHPHQDHNPYSRRCRPDWWMNRVHDVETLYIADGDYAAMLGRVDDVIESALRRMHEDEPPRHTRHHLPAGNRQDPRAPALNMVLGQRGIAAENHGPGVVGGIASAAANRGDRQRIGGHRVDVNFGQQDEPQLPPPRARRSRVKLEPVETIDLVSSSPPAVEAEVVMPLVLTLSVDVFGSTVPVGVTLGMGLRDAVVAAVAGSFLAGAHAGRFRFKGVGGEVWDRQRWEEVLEEGMSGRRAEGNPWSVVLVAM